MANVITCFRILCGLILLFCPTFSGRFYLFYLLGGISDVLDGMVARHLGTKTRLGARLDTAADSLFTVIVLIKVLRAVTVPRWMLLWIAVIAVVKCVNMIGGIVRLGHFAAEHSLLNKLCGGMLFAIPLCIGRFPWQPVAGLMILSCAVATVAAIEESIAVFTGKEIC